MFIAPTDSEGRGPRTSGGFAESTKVSNPSRVVYYARAFTLTCETSEPTSAKQNPIDSLRIMRGDNVWMF
jgi:hypothetical protein